MIDITRVWDRLYPKYGPSGDLISGVPDFKGRALTDFRAMVFVQELLIGPTTDLAAPASIGPKAQQFPGGAIILQITADCFPEGQPTNPFLRGLERFRIQQTYATQEQITTALGLAASVMGDAEYGGAYPVKELWLPPNQSILTTATNLTPEQIRITIAYHALVWRFAQ